MVIMNKIRYKVMLRSEDGQYKYLGSSTKKELLKKYLNDKYKDKDFRVYKMEDKEDDVTDEFKG